MDAIREYLLRIICTAMLCGVVTGLVGKKGAIGASLKLLTGVFMILTVVSPIVSVNLQSFTDYLDELTIDSNNLVTSGENMAMNSLAEIIKTKTEAYILDKAGSYGAELSVEVSVEYSELPVPCAVHISGSISPFGKKQLEKFIKDEIGIELEDQTWIG